MATTEEYKNGGSASYSFSIEYIKAEDIKVTVDGTSLTYTATNPPAQTTEYTVNGSNIIFKQASVSGSTTGGVRIYRETELENSDSVTFQAGSSIRAADLNANQKLVRLSAQEQNQKIVTDDIRDSQITSAKIKDGTIVDADVNASAAIAGTKISPDFGSQNITTTGTVNGVSTTEISILGGATVSTNELNTLDGVTANKDEINLLDGATVTTNEINILDGVTANKDELNILDGVTATTSELNTLDGVTASATEINILDGATISTTQLNNLQNIEPAAKDDQTATEIKTLYEDSGNNNASYIKTTYESNADTNEFTDAEKAKLGNLGSLNALSDVNTSGVADGKILKYDASASEFIIADDGGSGSGGATAFTGLSDTPANYGSAAGKTLKINSAGDAVEFVTVSTDVVDDQSPQLGGNLDVQDKEINTSTTNGNIKVTPNGTGLFEVKGNTNAGTLQLNCESNSHGVKIKSPPHSAAQDYTLTLPATNPSALSSAIGWIRINQNGELQIDPNDYVQVGEHINMGAFDITFDNTGGIYFDSDSSNNNKVGFFGNQTIPANINFSLPGADGPAGTFLKTDGAGNLSFASADVLADTTPELGGDLASNGHDIIFAQGDKAIFGSSNALQIYQSGNHVYIDEAGPGNLYIRNGTKNSIWCKTDGEVKLYYNDSDKLATTDTGISVTGNVVLSEAVLPAANNSKNIGSSSTKWAEVHATTFHGSGANLTDIDAGATGTGNDKIFWENGQTVTQSYTIGTTFNAACNAMSAGPIAINNNVVVTVDSGDTWTIV